MKFPHLPVHTMEDVTHDLEVLGGLLPNKMAFGTVTLTFTAAGTSNSPVVKHGLGMMPRVVVATSTSAPAFGKIPNCNTSFFTSSTFTINGETSTAWTGTVLVGWLAVA